MVAKLLDYFDQLEAVDVTNDGKLKEITDNMDNIEHQNKKKLSFFSEQLSLLSIKDPRRHRYSSDLLLWHACGRMSLLPCTNKFRMKTF